MRKLELQVLDSEGTALDRSRAWDVPQAVLRARPVWTIRTSVRRRTGTQLGCL